MDERYIAIPGTRMHELPPLLVHLAGDGAPEDGGSGLDSVMPEAEEMLSVTGADPLEIERRTLDLALQLTAKYRALMSHWLWGDSVLEWIRQCEITFECEETLRALLHPDVWPHASRSSFVTLLRKSTCRPTAWLWSRPWGCGSPSASRPRWIVSQISSSYT